MAPSAAECSSVTGERRTSVVMAAQKSYCATGLSELKTAVWHLGKGWGGRRPPPHPPALTGNQIAGGGGSKSTAFIGVFNVPKTNLNLVGPF